MPLMSLHRNFAMSTTRGHIINFQSGTPVNVPPVLVEEAVRIGAVFVDGSKIELLPPEKPGPYAGPPDPVARRDEIVTAMNEMIKANVRETFGADGQPKAEELSKLVGFKVEKKEITKVWLQRAEMIASGLLASDGSKGTAA